MADVKEIATYSERFQKALSTTNRKITAAIAKQLPDGLTGPQCYILKLIDEEKRMTASLLAEHMEVKPSAVTVMIDRLVQNGFVARTPDEFDRRVIQLQLTDKGKLAIDNVRHEFHTILSLLIHELDSDDRECFIRSFESIAQATSKLT
ncbi:MarR family transcriptional regulator [Paenibacillus mendelii]|nr:MarR family transcriptional regulator [Paenibacillus mendelii]